MAFHVRDWTILFLFLAVCVLVIELGLLDNRISELENKEQEEFVIIGSPNDEQFLIIHKEEVEEIKKELKK